MPFPRPVPTHSARVFAVILAAPLTGCSAELDVWTGAHLDYLHSPSLMACQGTYTYVDGFVPFLSEELGIAIPTGLEYRWLDENDFDDAPCRDSISGCSRGTSTYARSPILLHEVVHSITSSAGMNGHLFFTEGLAVAYDPWLGNGLGPRYTLAVREGDPLPDPRLELDAGTDNLDYALAGSFVTFLLTRHGPKKFVSFSRKIGKNASTSAIHDIFREVYDIELDTEVELFRFGPPCLDTPFAVRVYDCVAPEVGWNNNVLSFSSTVECGNTAVAGGIKAGAAIPNIRSVTFQVPVAGKYALSVGGDEGIVVQAGPCFGCPWVPSEVGTAAGSEVSADFASGPHYLRIRAETEDARVVRAVLRPTP